MDASALANALSNLEKSWASLDAWLNFWTAMVVVGVIVELAVIWKEYTDDRRDFLRGTIHSPEKPSTLLLILGLLGAGLVAIGVAGEFCIHIKAGKIETEMRDATRTFVALADKDAQTARERAVALELQMADRHVTLEQRKKMLAILKDRPRTKVSVTYLINAEKDAQEYSIEIE